MKHKNLAIIIGNLASDPIFEETSKGDSMAIMTVCSNFKTKDINGREKEEVEFHKCVCFGNSADNMKNFSLQKGSKIYVEGRLRTNYYTNKEGQDRESKQIVIEDWIALG